MNPENKKPIRRDFYANTKQIAERFSVSVKTIKAWVHKIGLPVHQNTPNSPYMLFEKDIKEKWLPKIRKFLEQKNRQMK